MREEHIHLKEVLFAASLILILWQTLSILMQHHALPAPLSVFKELIAMSNSQLIKHFLASLYRLIVSVSVSISIAVPFGMLLGRSQKINQIFAPMLYLLYPLPKVSLLPILLIFCGVGDLSKMVLIFLIIFFQILMTTRDASKGVDERYLTSVRSLGASEWDILIHVLIPACLPHIFSALRVSLGIGISVLFLTETYATNLGLGYLIMDALTRFNYVQVFAGVIAMSSMGLALFLCVDWIERRTCPWL